MTEDRALCFDLAKSTGWTAPMPSDASRPIFGTILIDPDGGRSTPRAYSHLRRAAAELIAIHKPTVISYEAPLPERREDGQVIHGFSTARFLLGIGAIIEEVSWTCGEIPCWDCDVQSVRLHFLGNGRASKADVWHRCAVLGWKPKNDDEADAGALWDFTRSTLQAGRVMAQREVKAREQWAT